MRLTPSSAGYQQAHWQIHDTKQRVLAASLAVLITLFLSLQFSYRSNRNSESEFLNRPITVLTLQVIPAIHARVEDQTPAKNEAMQKLRIIPVPVRRAVKVSDAPSTISAEITPAQTIDQPARQLTINSKSIAKAYNDSKSEIQKMAEASGKELNSPIKTKYDRFQTAAEQAVIPDCLSPQGPGGIGLFAIPVIAFQAATGICK